jgi:hypothetical protein
MLKIKRSLFDTIFFTTVLAMGIAIPAVASDWKDALKESLEASYPLSKRASFSPDRITRQGVVLVIQKQGIAADPSSDARYSITFVRDGQLGEQGGCDGSVFR